jgi:hypothetical protein
MYRVNGVVKVLLMTVGIYSVVVAVRMNTKKNTLNAKAVGMKLGKVI